MKCLNLNLKVKELGLKHNMRFNQLKLARK